MRSLYAHSGYLQIDHRDSPGISEEQVHSSHLQALVVPQGMLMEADTFTCSHCQRQVIYNAERLRKRDRCPKCDHVVCDWCYGEFQMNSLCITMKQRFEMLLERAARGENLVQI